MVTSQTVPPGWRRYAQRRDDREHRDLVSNASAGGVDQPEHGQFVAECALGSTNHFLDSAGAPRTRLDGRVVCYDDYRSSVNAAAAGDHTIRRQSLRKCVRQLSVLGPRPGIDECRYPLTHQQLSLGAQFLDGLVRR